MNKRELIKSKNKTITINDFASVLDSIKRQEFESISYCITERMLKHFSSDSISPKRSRIFHIKKKKGGVRVIKAPCQQLKVILTCINIFFRTLYEPSEAAMGFIPGRSVLHNARIHVGHNYVFNIDLKDFFTSITKTMVRRRLKLPPFLFSEEVANVIAGLCCSYDTLSKTNVLPQGFPTSPLLTNAICDNLDRKMQGVAQRFGLNYTRYVDDMTFSSMHNVYQERGEFYAEVQRIISEQGFSVNEAKTRLQKAKSHQEVTGLTVNSIVSVSRKFIRDLRWIINIWEKEGYAKASILFYFKYKNKNEFPQRVPLIEKVIGGRLNYLRMIRGIKNPAYHKLASRFALLNKMIVIDLASDYMQPYLAIKSYTAAEFQMLFQTVIFLEVSKNNSLIAKCSIDDKIMFLTISNSAQKIIRHNLDKIGGGVILSKFLDLCFVAFCRNKFGYYWLITDTEMNSSEKRMVY